MDPYLSTLESTQRQEVLRMEDQYISMLTEKYGMNEWFVKYQLNSNTGSYEPVFYNKDQVVNADYSDKTDTSLSGIKSYVYGQTTETREVKNAQARVEQDTSGRYVSIFIYETNADGTIKVDDKGNQIGTEYALTAKTQSDDRAYNRCYEPIQLQQSKIRSGYTIY